MMPFNVALKSHPKKLSIHLLWVQLTTVKNMQKELLVVFDRFVVTKRFNIAVNEFDVKKP